MTAKMRAAIVVIAWLVLVPLFVLAPGQTQSQAQIDTNFRAELADVDHQFGERLSQGSTQSTNDLVVAHNDNIRSAKKRAAAYLPRGFLPKPDFAIWPNESDNQIVNLESWMQITDGWEKRRWVFSGWFVTVVWSSRPIASEFTFKGTVTSDNNDSIYCPWKGFRWYPGLTNSPCGKEWDHSSDITGLVNSYAQVWHWITLSINGWTIMFPAPSPKSDVKELNVGEVLNYGLTTEVPVPVALPTGGDDEDGGICSVWGIKVICWVGEKAGEAALALLREIPFIDEIVTFLEGCGDAIMGQIDQIVSMLNTIKDAVTNPQEFLDETLQTLKDLWEAAKTDPEGLAVEVFEGLIDKDYYDTHGAIAWAGKMICDIAIEFLSGKLAVGIASKLDNFLKRRRAPDGTIHPCPIRRSSFPGETQVLMADDSYQRIDSIEPGDYVLSHNLDTSVWEPKLVLDQWSHLDRGPPSTLTLGDATVTATADHAFWVASTGTWTELQWVNAGDQLLTPTGPVTVDAVTTGPRHDWTVWELTVAGNHNFTVRTGDLDVLVHNNGAPCGGNGDDLGLPDHTPPARASIDGLDVYTGTKLGKNADGTWRGGWKQSPNLEKWRANGGSVYRTDDGGMIFRRADGVTVKYNADGYPDFSPYSRANVTIDGKGNHSTDFTAANRAAGLPGSKPPEGFTWHHVETTPGNCCEMQLVPTSIHNASQGGFPHRGGVSTN